MCSTVSDMLISSLRLLPRRNLSASRSRVRDVAEAHQYGKENPGVAVWTMAEIIRIVGNFDHFSKNLPSEAKVAFPGAEVSAIKNKGKLDDDIPF